jgi:hypothetical protein
MYLSGISKEEMAKMVKKLIRSLKPTGASEFETEMPLKVGRKDENLYYRLSDFQKVIRVHLLCVS